MKWKSSLSAYSKHTSYVPDKKDGRKNDGKNDRTSKLLLNKFTGTVIFTIIFTSIFFYPEHSYNDSP